jgi:histidinol-phosphatase (PHP family)
MLASYHNHSTFSDGKAPVDDMVAAAQRLGVGEVGLSDHLTLHPAGRAVKWSMKPEALPDYVRAVQRASERAVAAVRLGIELDWFEGHERALIAAIDAHPFDYVIGSVHFVGEFPIDGVPSRWDALSQPQVDDLHREYWRQVALMARSGLFDIAAHADLPKKFGRMPSRSPAAEIDAALEAIAAAGMVVEVNTAGWHKPCAEAYPSIGILRACRERGVETTISADAHRPEDILRDFDRAGLLLRDAGYTHVARFEGRTRRSEPLEFAVPTEPRTP